MKHGIEKAIQFGSCAVILLCAACSQEAAEIPEAEPAGEGQSAPEVQKVEKSVSTGMTMDEQIAGAVKDLADRSGIETDRITIKEARSVNWNSGAIGCPEPGMNYTQAIVPGMRLLLEADGTVYYYHGREGRSLAHCPADRAEAPAFGLGEEVM
jgi:hypothetical protein